MSSATLGQWAYAALRVGQTGQSGFQTYAASEDVQTQEQEELIALTCMPVEIALAQTAAPSTSALSPEAEPLSAYAFVPLRSGRLALFKTSHGATDDLGRPTYFAQAFLCQDFRQLTAPPWAYLHAENFSLKLQEHDKRSNKPAPTLPPLPIGSLRPCFPDSPAAWLSTRLLARTQLATAWDLAGVAFPEGKVEPFMVIGNDEDALLACALCWQAIDDELRSRLSFCTQFPLGSAGVFTIGGWLKERGYPDLENARNVRRVFTWSQPNVGTLSAISEIVRQRLAPILGPDERAASGTAEAAALVRHSDGPTPPPLPVRQQTERDWNEFRECFLKSGYDDKMAEATLWWIQSGRGLDSLASELADDASGWLYLWQAFLLGPPGHHPPRELILRLRKAVRNNAPLLEPLAISLREATSIQRAHLLHFFKTRDFPQLVDELADTLSLRELREIWDHDQPKWAGCIRERLKISNSPLGRARVVRLPPPPALDVLAPPTRTDDHETRGASRESDGPPEPSIFSRIVEWPDAHPVWSLVIITLLFLFFVLILAHHPILPWERD